MKFIFDSYNFDDTSGLVEFNYGFDDGRKFRESVQFEKQGEISEARKEALDRALFLAFMLVGTSYYKTFAGREVSGYGELDGFQAEFFGNVYHEGLGQFAFENDLKREDLAVFCGEGEKKTAAIEYDGRGVLLTQSGGKDSLLLEAMMERAGHKFVPFMVTSGESHPEVLDELGEELIAARRTIDREALKKAAEDGGMNGHVPVTYIMMSLALVQAILLGKKRVLMGIGHEGAEANTRLLDGMEVNHQWSKSWQAERDFARYVRDYISADLEIGSPLRCLSEMRIAELFYEVAWERFGHKFSSCNVANYRQNVDNSELKWCGNCPKCANSYLIFAPFVRGDELRSLFGGQELFEKESLQHDFKGLLGIDGVMKPFECIGEIDELRTAYRKAQMSGEYGELSFKVPEAKFDWRKTYECQEWARELMASLQESAGVE